MRTHESHPEPRLDFTVLDAASLLAIAMSGGPAGAPAGPPAPVRRTAPVGAWRSPDGTVRLNLRTDGTYAGKVAGRRRPAHGTYHLDGSTVTLQDDSGLRT